MKEAVRTEGFAAWMHRLRDDVAVAKIAIRIDRLRAGNPGDVKPVGGGVSEMRIDYGPGYRVYYTEHQEAVVLLLHGGTKKTQPGDIKKARHLFAEWKKQK